MSGAGSSDVPAEWTMPDIGYLFPERCSPFAEAVETHTRAWLDHHHLADDPKQHSRLERALSGETQARAFATATQPMLEFIADLFLWLIAFDDNYVEVPEATGTNLAPHVTAFLDVLEHTTSRGGTGFVAALTDLTERMNSLLTALQADRFIAEMQAALLSFLWQADSATTRIGLSEYRTVRPITAFARIAVALIKPAARLDLRGGLRESSNVRRLDRALANVIGWGNDLYTFDYEYRSTGTLLRTLPTVIARQYGCSLSTAFDRARQMCEEEAAEAHALITELIASELIASEVPALRVYAHGASDSIAGLIWWHVTPRSGRYRPP